MQSNQKDLKKFFGDIHSIIDIDLVIHKGFLYRFLALNYAGKTRSISILSIFLKSVIRTDSILGYDILKDAKRFMELNNFAEWTKLQF